MKPNLSSNSFIPSRRQMLKTAGMGLGYLALRTMELDDCSARAGVSKRTANAGGKAKSVIFLFMAGGPSHVDTFDPKPVLTKLDGKETPESIRRLFKRSATMGNGTRRLMASPYRFAQHGKSGLLVSDLLPHTARCADDLCLLRSLQHDSVIHIPSEYMLTTGSTLGNRPSLGSWLLYGLGSESKDLPGFVVFGNPPRPATGSAFLPARFQGTNISAGNKPIPNLSLPREVSSGQRREQLSLIERFNRQHLERQGGGDSQLEARIRSYELAFRMQAEAPEAFSIQGETARTQSLYGVGEKTTDAVGRQCLMARRLVERGVRFVQIRVDGWDSHDDLKGGHDAAAGKSDQPIAALLTDLKRRGLLDSTLVVWGGEFGRTPGAEKKGGRDHSPGGFTMWLAGGGVRGGRVIGETDPVGYTAIDRPITPNALHATILHGLGIDQLKLTFPLNGRDEIPTFLPAEVVTDAFA